MTENSTTNTTKTYEVVVTRIIDAPVELVWKAWTEPEQVVRWWGPQFYTSPFCKIDLREGGKYVFAMLAPVEQGGQESYTTGVYKKIVPMERLEFTQVLCDREGNPVDPSQVGMPPDFPKETLAVVTFRRIRPDMTELIVTEYGWTPGLMMVFSYAGMQQSIDKLSQVLS